LACDYWTSKYHIGAEEKLNNFSAAPLPSKFDIILLMPVLEF